MITDSDTNVLYLADCLPKKQPIFFERFQAVLKDCKINFQFLPDTRDIWAVDYMPVQVTKENFIQFTYNPDYLQSKTWLKSISDVDAICKAIKLTPKKTDIVVDGGNVIRSKDKVIMCDKVFKENPRYPEKTLQKELEELLEVDELIFVPQHPKDEIGHADGMVRFLDNYTVLVNDFSKEKTEYQLAFRNSLQNAGLDCIEIPYNPYKNKKDIQANGIYINYLEMNGVVIVPIFGMKDDEQAVKIFEQLFKGQRIKAMDSSEIAVEGGVLNCISWNIVS